MSVKPIILGAGAGAGLMAIVLNATVPTIQNLEGIKNTPYKDIGGVLTVCSGHTGVDVVAKKVYTNAECADLTESDVQKAASGVLKTSPQMIYHPLQLAAAISFSYNVGIGDYGKSSVSRYFNQGQFALGCAELLKYVYAGGKYSPGLFNRRKQEYLICTSTLTPKGLSNVGISSGAGQ